MTWILFEKCLWAALAAIGFATLFTAPIRVFWATALLAALGYGLRGITLHYGGDLLSGTLIASCTMGLLAIQIAHWVHTPTTVFMAPAVIPMVPGVFAYRSMMGLMELSRAQEASADLLILAVGNGLNTIFVLLALAIGVSLPSLLFRNRSVKEIRFINSRKGRV
ncbi:threonine/serine exporter [Endozoicomonas sp. OPT23]|uniref:threonine/serine exporter family protein n=1 Tax=Endozoicomonas sp. OPT23 TaxID=2072845 RepID=UPI00129BB018|nr:threonine/serine exporter family protein [Endozoicomonas sp. OPT23]MRI32881.1 threonine/serine exporter [Endozoicomonas sp. OPT23]